MGLKYSAHLTLLGAQNARYAKTISPADECANKKTKKHHTWYCNYTNIGDVLIMLGPIIKDNLEQEVWGILLVLAGTFMAWRISNPHVATRPQSNHAAQEPGCYYHLLKQLFCN